MLILIKKSLIYLVLSIYFISGSVNAQQKYWVFLKDKKGVQFDPYQYFDNKAIERRLRLGLSLYDSTDFPVSDEYVRGIEEIAGTVDSKLRWFNALTVNLFDNQVKLVENLPFVSRIEVMQNHDFVPASNYDTLLRTDDIKLLEIQIKRMQGELFAAKGYTGKGKRIAVFDAGFPGVDKLPVFKHLWTNNLIKATWDFTRKKPEVYYSNEHGTMVLSCIAGIINGRKMGMAIDAEFLLAKTEIERETFSEEEYWLQAAEWADKNGADIINSSLAYTFERYYTFEMDGHTSLVAKAASMASNKGMLVINAMGNDGLADWKILATPADADSVLSVGAINPLTDFHAGFSSFGPTAKYKMKPNVVAPGRVVAAGKQKLEKVQGTSFAAPLISGFAACAWQCMPYLTNMQLFEKIEQSGHLFPYFDYAHGYGVPQASWFINQGKALMPEPTFEFKLSDDSLFIEVNPEFIDRKYFRSNNYLYYHIENENNYIESYWLIDVFTQKAAIINLREYPQGKTIRAHYKGFTNEYHLK